MSTYTVIQFQTDGQVAWLLSGSQTRTRTKDHKTGFLKKDPGRRATMTRKSSIKQGSTETLTPRKHVEVSIYGSLMYSHDRLREVSSRLREIERELTILGWSG